MTSIPDTPDELLRLQGQSDYLRQVMELRSQLDPSPADDLALAIALVESHHDGHRDMVTDLIADATLPRDQIAAWSVDGERLQMALLLLRAVEPPQAADGDEEVPA